MCAILAIQKYRARNANAPGRWLGGIPRGGSRGIVDTLVTTPNLN
jgi:hypothetical protein